MCSIVGEGKDLLGEADHVADVVSFLENECEMDKLELCDEVDVDDCDIDFRLLQDAERLPQSGDGLVELKRVDDNEAVAETETLTLLVSEIDALQVVVRVDDGVCLE